MSIQTKASGNRVWIWEPTSRNTPLTSINYGCMDVSGMLRDVRFKNIISQKRWKRWCRNCTLCSFLFVYSSVPSSISKLDLKLCLHQISESFRISLSSGLMPSALLRIIMYVRKGFLYSCLCRESFCRTVQPTHWTVWDYGFTIFSSSRNILGLHQEPLALFAFSCSAKLDLQLRWEPQILHAQHCFGILWQHFLK